MVLWDPVQLKAQLRLTSKRLSQLQDKKDSLAQITRRDIATLLERRNVGLARAKAQNLMQEDVMGDMLEILEMHCGVLLERFTELEGSKLNLNPTILESTSTIIFAAPKTESKDLNVVRDLLIARLGPDLTHSAVRNTDNHVSPRLLQAMNAPPAAAIDDYLLRIARSFNVKWTPDMKPHEKLNALSELLDSSNLVSAVDMQKLRHISSSGIPHHPPWLRPRVWKLLLGTLPSSKAQWESEAQKQRASYYDLIRRLLDPIAECPPPTTPLSAADRNLVNVLDALTRVPPNLLSLLEQELEPSDLCPLHDTASPDLRIACATSLDSRLDMIRGQNSDKVVTLRTPEIRLEMDGDSYPSTTHGSDAQQASTPTTTLHPSQSLKDINAHKIHISALLRLLFIHSSLHPADHSPHIASLLIPLYAVLNREVEPSELAHIEADTFWLFEALVSEVSELEEEEAGNSWMRKFGDRLKWADDELFDSLHRKGLDPALPHYSYKWLAPLLTHTLPFSPLLTIWDVLFAQPSRLRASNPKLECLLDVCTAMLVRARVHLLRLGKSGRRSPSLWNEDDSIPPPSPSRPWELHDAFMEGMTLLQRYPINDAGGVERILQVASDLSARREEEAKLPSQQNFSLGAKLRDTVWRGFTNHIPSSDSSDNDGDHEEEYEGASGGIDLDHSTEVTAGTMGLASRLRTTVWRGITNQSAMDTPPSPILPSPRLSPKPEQKLANSESVQSELTPGLWNYAEKLKDSDVAARLSKVSTNLTIRAREAWVARNRPSENNSATSSSSLSPERVSSPLQKLTTEHDDEPRRGSLPNIDRTDVYSPPARPAHFSAPRDSWMLRPQKGPMLSVPTSPESTSSIASLSDSGADNMNPFRASLASWVGLQTPVPKPAVKSGPRPLLLNSSSLITSVPPSQIIRSASNTPIPHQGQWTDVLRSRVQTPRRHDSQWSLSSLSTDAHGRSRKSDSRSDWDSDTSASRIVHLNRGSVSPMAPAFRVPRHRPSSNSSHSERDALSPPPMSQTMYGTVHSEPASKRNSSDGNSTKGWERVEAPDSPAASPPPPPTPVTWNSVGNSSVRVSNSERRRGSVVLSESGMLPVEALVGPQVPAQKVSAPPTALQSEDTSDSSVSSLSPSKTPSKSRLKRHVLRPPNLRVRDAEGSRQGVVLDQQALSPSHLEAPEQFTDVAVTPKALEFPISSPAEQRPRRTRKALIDSNDALLRKISKDGHINRSQKISDASHRRGESAANEGDDEGYDELLSAYESEEGHGSKWFEIHG